MALPVELLVGGAGRLKVNVKGAVIEEETKAGRDSKSDLGKVEGVGLTRLGGAAESPEGAKVSISKTNKSVASDVDSPKRGSRGSR